jgi:hypothetical protein
VQVYVYLFSIIYTATYREHNAALAGLHINTQSILSCIILLRKNALIYKQEQRYTSHKRHKFVGQQDNILLDTNHTQI